MIDTHCHILPGVDDGPETLAEALKMARKAVDQGITHLLCTPHYNQRYRNVKQDILQAVSRLQKELDDRQIPLVLFEGQEVRISDTLVEEIKSDRILFTDVADTYLLVELPTKEVPVYSEQVLYDLRNLGHVPIIVHPERNLAIQDDPGLLLPLLNLGCYTQLTAPSITGVFGERPQELAFELIETGCAHLVASDAHGVDKRDFYLKQAHSMIRKKCGVVTAGRFLQHEKDVVNGDPLMFA